MPDHSAPAAISSDEIALRYLETLPWPPYPFQEQCILTWFGCEDGLLVCAPTGTGKTVIAEAALYEALMTGRRAYYTTPLIALTEQKFQELQQAVVRWGFAPDDVGLITGNRKVNPEARILVVVAEILLNRLLERETAPAEPDSAPGSDGSGGGSGTFRFDDVSAVVMDEFHSFNDPERGIVWELSLGLLPRSIRVLLISATVGNAPEFVVWLSRQHGRRLRLLQSEERRVPLDFRWIPDELLADQLESMAEGDEDARYTPALVFCFNRSACWDVAEQIKGKRLLADGQQKELQAELERYDWSVGAGGKLKQILIRGVGIHHAGVLPKYRRIIERLFQKKLLTICVCTETLAAGINLPARSVVMTSLLKGPRGRMSLIDASSAHQMFGRAGRPQYDSQGYVFAVAHEDDVRIHRWQEQYDSIPDDTRDPLLIRAKKKLKRKMPRRREGQQYWSEKQFQTLRAAPPGRLASRGQLPWRMLAWFIRRFGTMAALEDAVHRRMLSEELREREQKSLRQMLLTLESGGFITLDPPPPSSGHGNDDWEGFRSRLFSGSASSLLPEIQEGARSRISRWVWHEGDDPHADTPAASASDDADAGDFGVGIFADADDESPEHGEQQNERARSDGPPAIAEDDEASDTEASANSPGLLGQLIQEARETGDVASTRSESPGASAAEEGDTVETSPDPRDTWEPRLAVATETLPLLFAFRSVNSIYGVFLAEHMHRASYNERLQLLEAVLAMPMSVARMVRVPFPDRMPPGPLATDYLNPQLISRGLATVEELQGFRDEETGRRIPPLTLADKMRLLFRSEFPGVRDVQSTAVWCIGDLLSFGGDFNRYVRARELTKQEGIVFRHCLRMVLLCDEFAQLEPPGLAADDWRHDLAALAAMLTTTCREVDPASTDETLEQLATRRSEPAIV